MMNGSFRFLLPRSPPLHLSARTVKPGDDTPTPSTTATATTTTTTITTTEATTSKRCGTKRKNPEKFEQIVFKISFPKKPETFIFPAEKKFFSDFVFGQKQKKSQQLKREELHLKCLTRYRKISGEKTVTVPEKYPDVW